MKRIMVQIPAVIAVPTSADEWQLYTATAKSANELAQLERAAVALTGAITECTREMVRDETMSSTRAMAEIFMPVAEKHANTGAADTEPRDLAGAILTKFEKLLRGAKPS